MEENSETLVIEGVNKDDLQLLRSHGIDPVRFVRELVYARAEEIRAEERERDAYRRRVIREVADERRASGVDYSADEIVADIHADRREAGWE